MKKNNYPYFYVKKRSHEEMAEGTIIVNDKEDDHFITTGYFDSACRDIIASTFHKRASCLQAAYRCILYRPCKIIKAGTLVRVRNKLFLQVQQGLTVDPDKVLFTMTHRMVEQKGF